MGVLGESELVGRLVAAGTKMDDDIGATLDDLVEEPVDENQFITAIAYSLTWTGHANQKYLDTFVKQSTAYLKTGDHGKLQEAIGHFGRFSPEQLENALKGWKLILDESKAKIGAKCTVDEIIAMQKRCLDWASILLSKGKLHGVGAWLFSAPFKIICAQRNDLWANEKLDDIMLPSGLEVVRGIKKAKKHGYMFADDLDSNHLVETEGDLLEGMGSVSLIHNLCKTLAKNANTRAVHLNSGLYAYGAGEVSDEE
jgi:hypothetical protein